MLRVNGQAQQLYLVCQQPRSDVADYCAVASLRHHDHAVISPKGVLHHLQIDYSLDY